MAICSLYNIWLRENDLFTVGSDNAVFYRLQPVEYRVITAHGEKIILSQPNIIKAANGHAVLYRGIVRDITLQKKAERQILAMKDELAQHASDRYRTLFNAM